MGKYDDIINLPHHVSDYHKQMPMENRAAQFAPFAALTGHEEAIMEAARLTEVKKELSEYEINCITQNVQIAFENHIQVGITYFVKDSQKSGGYYTQVTGFIQKWDDEENLLLMSDGSIIPTHNISEVILKASI